MKLGLKFVKDLNVNDTLVIRKETNIKHSSNITLNKIKNISIEVIHKDNKILSAFLGRKIPQQTYRLYNIDENYWAENELVEIILND